MGRPWPQPGEQLFTPQDTADVLEYMREKALECPGCGHPRDESMAKENQHAYDAEPVRCFACAARDRRADRFHKDGGLSAGLKFSITSLND